MWNLYILLNFIVSESEFQTLSKFKKKIFPIFLSNSANNKHTFYILKCNSELVMKSFKKREKIFWGTAISFFFVEK